MSIMVADNSTLSSLQKGQASVVEQLPTLSTSSGSVSDTVLPLAVHPLAARTNSCGSPPLPLRTSTEQVLISDLNSGNIAVGDHVYMGGMKSGVVAFVGKTSFAPGLWAGITLDAQGMGKNDGSVQGIRYFQCEALRGVFSRPHKLMRYASTPLPACSAPSHPSHSPHLLLPGTDHPDSPSPPSALSSSAACSVLPSGAALFKSPDTSPLLPSHGHVSLPITMSSVTDTNRSLPPRASSAATLSTSHSGACFSASAAGMSLPLDPGHLAVPAASLWLPDRSCSSLPITSPGWTGWDQLASPTTLVSWAASKPANWDTSPRPSVPLRPLRRDAVSPDTLSLTRDRLPQSPNLTHNVSGSSQWRRNGESGDASASNMTSSFEDSGNGGNNEVHADWPSSLAAQPLHLGERVIVIGNAKVGVLRFLGPVDFARGDWAGIELDEPHGKNDGSVAGKRYFECQHSYGLFAPAHKVSREVAAGTTDLSLSTSRGTTVSATSHLTAARARPVSPATSTAHSALPQATPRQPSIPAAIAAAVTRTPSNVGRQALGVTSPVERSTSPSLIPRSTPCRPRAHSTSDTSSPGSSIGSTSPASKMTGSLALQDASSLAEQVAAVADDKNCKATVVSKEETEAVHSYSNEKISLLQMKIIQLEKEKESAAMQADDQRRKNEDLQFQLEELSISLDEVKELHKGDEHARKTLQLELQTERTARCEAQAQVQTLKNDLHDERQNVISSKQSCIAYIEQVEVLHKKLGNAKELLLKVKDKEGHLEAVAHMPFAAAQEMETDQHRDAVVVKKRVEPSFASMTADAVLPVSCGVGEGTVDDGDGLSNMVEELLCKKVQVMDPAVMSGAMPSATPAGGINGDFGITTQLISQNDVTISELVEGMKLLKDEMHSLWLEREGQERVITELQNKLLSSSVEASCLGLEVQHLRSSMQDFRKQLVSSEEKHTGLLQDRNKLELELAEIMRSSERSLQQLSSLSDQLKAKDRHIGDLQMELLSRSQAIARLQERPSGKQSPEQERQFVSHKGDLRVVQGRLEEAQSQLMRLRQTVSELKDKHATELANLCTHYEQRMMEMSLAVAPENGQTDTHNVSLLRKLQTNNEKLSLELKAAVSKKDAAESRYLESSRDYSLLREELVEMRHTVQKLHEERAKLEEELSVRLDGACHEKISLLREKLQVEAQLKEKSLHMEQVQQQLDRTQMEIRVWKQSIEGQLEEARQASEDDLDSLRERLFTSIAASEEMQKQLARSADDRRLLVQEIEAMQREGSLHKAELEGVTLKLKSEIEQGKQREKLTQQLFNAERDSFNKEIETLKQFMHNLEAELQHYSAMVQALKADNMAVPGTSGLWMSIPPSPGGSSVGKDSQTRTVGHGHRSSQQAGILPEVERLHSPSSEPFNWQRLGSAKPELAGSAQQPQEQQQQPRQHHSHQPHQQHGAELPKPQSSSTRSSRTSHRASGSDGGQRLESLFTWSAVCAVNHTSTLLPNQKDARSRTTSSEMYCDICNTYDNHDTGDCPRQATSSAASPSRSPHVSPSLMWPRSSSPSQSTTGLGHS